MARKSKEERLAEQKAMLDKVSHSADSNRASRPARPSVFGKNMISDANMKLEQANAQIVSLESQIEKLKNNNTSPELIATLENEIKSLRSKATLELDPNLITITRFANRDEVFFQTAEFFELVESIRENNQAIPITVRLSKDGDGFDLISGRRRLEVCKILERTVTSILVEADDKKLTELQVLENFRDDLSHFEEADNFELMITEGFFKNSSELAKTLSISKAKISQLRSIAKIPKWLRDEFLIEVNRVKRPLPSGEIKEVSELNMAPSRLCYELSQHIDADFESKHSGAIKGAAESITATGTFKGRVQKIISLIEGEGLQNEQTKEPAVKNKIKVGEKVVAETTVSDGSWQVKVPKKYNSKELTAELERVTNEVLEAYFNDKNA
jgi:ParB/RepB/Spo0J family partition protein